jgi:hypothetical protein
MDLAEAMDAAQAAKSDLVLLPLSAEPQLAVILSHEKLVQ